MENTQKRTDAPQGGLVTKRCTSVVAKQRTDEVRRMMMKGLSTSTISMDCSAKWGVTERQVQNYVTKILHEMAEASKLFSTEAKVARRRDQLENLYETCVLKQDYKTAAIILDKLCRIDGAYAPDQIRFDVRHRVEQLNPDEREQRLKYLMKQRQDYIDAQFDEVEDEDGGDGDDS